MRASFIPGLHIPGQNFPLLPENLSKSVNRLEIPEDLVREYRGGKKNPVSEYITDLLSCSCNFVNVLESAVQSPLAIYLSISSIHLYLSIYPSFHPSLSIYPSILLSISIYPSILPSLSIHPSLSIYLSIHPSISIYLSLGPFCA